MRIVAFVVALLAAWPSASSAVLNPLPRIRHVFIIILENKGYDETFGSGSAAPYLSQQLTQQGQLLRQYYATGHVSLDNYIALVSGQAPNSQTQSDCQFYTDFAGAPSLDADGQAVGQGCVYPTFVPTIADQVRGAVRTGVRGMDGALGQHEAVTGTEAELAIAGAEGDLAGDDPDALVVVVRVRRVVRARVVGPAEDGEAVALEPVAKGGLGDGVGAGPGDELEAHGPSLLGWRVAVNRGRSLPPLRPPPLTTTSITPPKRCQPRASATAGMRWPPGRGTRPRTRRRASRIGSPK